MPAPDTPAQLKARALRYLARREHSCAELARKLALHTGSPSDVQAVMDDLRSRKQVCDERFAEERARVLGRRFGPAKIRHDLKTRGIAEPLIDTLLPGREDELRCARAVLERRYGAPASSREERAQRMRFLQRRGFSTGVALRLVTGAEEPA